MIPKKYDKEVRQLSKDLPAVYKLLEWEWYDGLPSETRIYKIFEMLYNDVRKCSYLGECSTGGLYVKKYIEEGDVAVYEFGFNKSVEFYKMV